MGEDVDAKPADGGVKTRSPGVESPSETGLAEGAFAITVAFELNENAFNEFYRLVTENAATSVNLEPDCIRFDVLTPVQAGTGPDVVLYEIYRTRAAFELHLASEHFLSFDRLTRDLVRTKTVLAFNALENAKSGVRND